MLYERYHNRPNKAFAKVQHSLMIELNKYRRSLPQHNKGHIYIYGKPTATGKC
jgi:hypothetical protein